MRTLIHFVLLLTVAVGLNGAAPAASATPKLGGHTVVGRINADSSREPGGARPYEKFSYNLRTGDRLEVTLRAAGDDGGLLRERRASEKVTLYFDRGDNAGLQEASKDPQGQYFRVVAPGSASGETTYYFYVIGRSPGTTARYDLTFNTTTQKQPYPIYQHLEIEGQLAAHQNVLRTFQLSVTNWAHRFRVESNDFQPKLERVIIQNGQRLSISSSTDRRTATSATTLFNPSAPGPSDIIIKNESNRAGVYRLVAEIPLPLTMR